MDEKVLSRVAPAPQDDVEPGTRVPGSALGSYLLEAVEVDLHHLREMIREAIAIGLS